MPPVVAVVAAALLTADAAHADRRAGGGARDYAAEAQLFYRAVACGGDRPVPDAIAAAVTAHCDALARPVARFRARYLDRAAPFLARLRPAGLPSAVVYPFGGGDLVSALMTYPDAAEITTISLEHAGDPRRLSGLDARALGKSLRLFRDTAAGLLRNNDHASINLKKMERGPIPGQLAFFALALAVHGMEPVSMRFFRVEPDGSLHYYSDAEIARLDGVLARKKAGSWIDTDYSVAFSNVEIRFRERGDPGARVRVHRHIAANLANGSFRGSPLRAHLSAKGRVAAMTKAASYLLWNNGFSGIRDYLLQNMVFMVSDSTGIPPRLARRAGFEQITYGLFETPFLEGARDSPHAEDFARLWTSRRRRRLPFRYGYPDGNANYHLVITRPAPPRAGARSQTGRGAAPCAGRSCR